MNKVVFVRILAAERLEKQEKAGKDKRNPRNNFNSISGASTQRVLTIDVTVDAKKISLLTNLEVKKDFHKNRLNPVHEIDKEKRCSLTGS